MFGVAKARHAKPVHAGLILKELDYQNPFSVYRILRKHYSPSFILESSPGNEKLGQYTFVGFAPKQIICLQDDRITVDGKYAGFATDPLNYLRKKLGQYRVDQDQFKYIGGWVGYIGYDFVRYLEMLPLKPNKEFPDLLFGLFLDGLIFDHREKRCYYFSHTEDRSEAVAYILKTDDLNQEQFVLRSLSPNMTKKEFIDRVWRAKEYIRRGDIYQVVLSRQLLGRFTGNLLLVYERLRKLNPSPYMYFLDFGQVQIAGSSPEMLLQVQGDRLTTYPIAGTRPVSDDAVLNQRYQEELLSDEKELAEHNMLVDLARNDIGRVSQFGSVSVPEYLKVERFSHVQHLVSSVQGRLLKNKDSFDALAAVFPAGTVSGAPKIRAMEIIAEQEKSTRGPYAGIIGYLSLNGNMDSAIGIRTIFAHGSEFYLQAGAGIVADSIPAQEWEETEKKLGALMVALSLESEVVS